MLAACVCVEIVRLVAKRQRSKQKKDSAAKCCGSMHSPCRRECLTNSPTDTAAATSDNGSSACSCHRTHVTLGSATAPNGLVRSTCWWRVRWS
jgi:hypothetical protein